MFTTSLFKSCGGYAPEQKILMFDGIFAGIYDGVSLVILCGALSIRSNC